MSVKIHLWLQRPPHVQWCLKVVVETEEGVGIARTWFDEFEPTVRPPPSVINPMAELLERLARQAITGVINHCSLPGAPDVGRKFQIERSV